MTGLIRIMWYGVGSVVGSPLLTFGAITSLILWDSRYWDNCCEALFEKALSLPKQKWS